MENGVCKSFLYSCTIFHDLVMNPDDTPSGIVNIVGVIRYNDENDHCHPDYRIWGYDPGKKIWMADEFSLLTHPLAGNSEPADDTDTDMPVVAWLEAEYHRDECTNMIIDEINARKEYYNG